VIENEEQKGVQTKQQKVARRESKEGGSTKREVKQMLKRTAKRRKRKTAY